MNTKANLALIKDVLNAIATPEEKAAFLALLGADREAKANWVLTKAPLAITEAQRQAVYDAVTLTRDERAALAGQAVRALIFRVLSKLGF